MKSIALTAVSLSIALAAPALAAPTASTAAAPAPAAQQQHRHAKAAMTTNSPEAREMTAALNALEADGYGDFSNFKANGSTFTATVTQNGKQFTVQVDPTTGQVTRQG